MSDASAIRYVLPPLLLIISCLPEGGCSGCGDDKPASGDLDLIGRTVNQADGNSLKKKNKSRKDQRRLLFAVDLLQDIVFRYQRDGWTLSTPEAHVNAEKLKESGLDLVLAGLPLSPGRSPLTTLEKAIADMETLAAATDGKIVIASTYPEAKKLVRSGAIALMLLAEGADAFVRKPSDIGRFKDRGLAVVGLVGGRGNGFADTAISPREKGGLTRKGRTFLEYCRDAKIAVDLTHASEKTFWDARAVQAGAVMVSHTACRALMDHPRNLNDLQIISLSRFGGLMGLIFNPVFLAPGGEAALETVVAHILHIRALGAVGSLGLGTDFDGVHPPKGLEHVGDLDRLFDALLEQGLSDEEIAGIVGKNAERFFDELHREFGAVAHTEDDMVRPLAVECDSVAGESDGILSAACDGFVVRDGPHLRPSSRQRIRLKDVSSTPVTLELFGEPGVPWQVEGQNLEGRILFHRFVQLNDKGNGTMSLPEGRNLTRLFLSPTRKSALKEAVVWGRPALTE